MLEDDIESASFTVISTDSLLAFKTEYYLQVYLENCAFKIANKRMADYFDENIFDD